MVVYAILYTIRPLSERVVDVTLCACVAMGSAKCTRTIYVLYRGISDYTMQLAHAPAGRGSEHKECFGTAQTLRTVFG